MHGVLPVMTLISGTLSGDRFTERAFLSKASLSILFLVAEPQSLYKPVARNNVIIFVATFLRFLIHTDDIEPSSLHFLDATPYDNRNVLDSHY